MRRVPGLSPLAGMGKGAGISLGMQCLQQSWELHAGAHWVPVTSVELKGALTAGDAAPKPLV